MSQVGCETWVWNATKRHSVRMTLELKHCAISPLKISRNSALPASAIGVSCWWQSPRAWRKLHIGMDADTGEIVAATLTTNDLDDASQIGSLLDQVEGPLISFTGDGAYDQDSVYGAVINRDPDAAVVVPPRATAVPSEMAATEPTQRDRHLQSIAEKGRIGWQRMSGYNKRSRVEASIGRYKQVIGSGLRFRNDERRATEPSSASAIAASSISFLVTATAAISLLSASTSICSFRHDRRRDAPCFSTSHSPAPPSFRPVLSTSRCSGPVSGRRSDGTSSVFARRLSVEGSKRRGQARAVR
jgi:Transposase DDE domain